MMLKLVYDGNDIVVLIGAGRVLTTLPPIRLCICLDINKRSIFAGIVQVNGSLSRKKNIFALFYYSKNIEDLLHAIKIGSRNKSIQVLIQHYIPSLNHRKRRYIISLFSSLRKAIKVDIIRDITLVYDFSSKRNTWTKTKLLYMLNHNT